MFKLNYIMIGSLPEQERRYLEKNLRTDTAKADVVQITGWENEKNMLEGLCHYPAGESILISANQRHLRAAGERGMATLGYLPPGETAEFMADMYAEGMEEVGLIFVRHVFERHHNLPWIILETDRCIVREFSMDYLDALFALYAGKGMTDYIEPLYAYEKERAYQEAYIEHMYRFYGYGMWIVCEKGSGNLIGRVGVEHREELGGELELGYAIGVLYQQQGYATEVCLAVLDYVRSELENTKINCLIETGNEVSEHFARRLGFYPEGTLKLEGKQMKRYVLRF